MPLLKVLTHSPTYLLIYSPTHSLTLTHLLTHLLTHSYSLTHRVAMAVNGNPNAYSIKVPMRDKNNCDFSYAGLKNSFRMAVMKAREDLGISDYDRLLTHSLTHSLLLTHSVQMRLPDKWKRHRLL